MKQTDVLSSACPAMQTDNATGQKAVCVLEQKSSARRQGKERFCCTPNVEQPEGCINRFYSTHCPHEANLCACKHQKYNIKPPLASSKQQQQQTSLLENMFTSAMRSSLLA
jgi:hypothetical protein